MNRVEFQKTANERILDAKALLSARRWAAAYYLAGYAVECGLKACVLSRVTGEPDVIFADRKYSEKCWTHNLSQLMELGKIQEDFDNDCRTNPDLLKSWVEVKDWTEESRYLHATKDDAQRLFEAITNKKHGVLTWIKRRW